MHGSWTSKEKGKLGSGEKKVCILFLSSPQPNGVPPQPKLSSPKAIHTFRRPFFDFKSQAFLAQRKPNDNRRFKGVVVIAVNADAEKFRTCEEA